ncbi:MAG: sensor histidine kinase [Deltaproteobacteria bacterium]|nr:sensor histidine kinase [Deltaproteobacteria bacterium]
MWIVLAFLAGGIALSWGFRRAVESAFVARLDSLLLAVVAAIEVPPTGAPTLARDIPDPAFDRVYSGWYWQVSDGTHRLTSRSLWDAVLASAATQSAEPAALRLVGPRNEALRVVERRLTYPGRLQPLVVTVAAPQAELQRDIARFDRLLAAALGALAATLLLAVAVQVGYGLRPLRRLGRELRDVQHGRQARLGVRYPHEIQTLVGAMNDVLDRDAGRIARAREHAGNLAHGLKTPLAVLAVEATQPVPDRARIAAEVKRMASVIDRHLTRAAAAGSHQAVGPRAEIGSVVAEIRTTIQRIYAERRLAIDVRVPAGLVFAGERQDLEEMLGNLVDNAGKWAASRVSISAERRDDALEIAVGDDGPGLSSAATSRAVERGTRLDHDTPGSGLGLSITSDLAALYGGTLRFDRGTLGGLRATLRLPIA